MLRTRRSGVMRTSLRFETLEHRQLMAADTLAATAGAADPTGDGLVAPCDAVATFGNASGADIGVRKDQPVLYFNNVLNTEADTTGDDMLELASADFLHATAGELIAPFNAQATTGDTTKLLHFCNADYESMAIREFIDAYISEINLPALFGGSKDPAGMTLELDVTDVHHKKGNGDVVSGVIGEMHKSWQCANFCVEIGGLSCAYVGNVELPKLTVKVIEQPKTLDPWITDSHESLLNADIVVGLAARAFRPPRITPKSFVPDTQTAVVVGKGGEEIYTDRYGSVKVQFHWDRYGEKDDSCSCWIRVSRNWSGQSWGGISIPRIGQEVVVEFLEGDPDRPVVLQRLYNGEQTPPYTLPATSLRSTSTNDGGGYNEIEADDTMGEEQIREHGDRRLELGNEPVAPYDAKATFGDASGADAKALKPGAVPVTSSTKQR